MLVPTFAKRHRPAVLRNPAVAIFAAFGAAKIALLLVFGPATQPDSGLYAAFAERILHDTAWLSDAEFATQSLPITAFRPIGYPAVIALAKLAGGGAFATVLALAQIAMSLVAAGFVLRLADAILGSRTWALWAVIGYFVSITAIYDQSILTDSLYASLFVIVFASLTLGFLDRRPMEMKTLVWLGVLFAASVLVRGIGLYFVAFLVPVLAAWGWRAPGRPALRFAAVVLFLVPLAVTVVANTSWNAYRTGHFFMTTGAQFVLVQPLVKIGRAGLNVFDAATPLDTLARRELRAFTYNEIGPINDAMFSEYGLDAYEIAAANTAKYLDTVVRFPLAILKNGARNFEEPIIYSFFNPAYTYVRYRSLVLNQWVWTGRHKLMREVREEGRIGNLILLAFVYIFRLVSAVAFTMFLVGLPILVVGRAVKRRQMNARYAAAVYLWLLFVGFVGVLLLIHFVPRFLLAVLPAGLIVSLFVAQHLKRPRAPGPLA